MSRTRKKRRPRQSAQLSPPGVGFELAILGRWAGVAVILIAGVVMLAISWRKWLDPLVDFGRELYVPWQLSQGQMLYRDIAYFRGPLSPYFNALLFKTFGVGLMSIAWVNIAILAGLTFLIYRLLCLVGSRLGAVLGCVIFLVIFGLAQFLNTANYNFVCPYSHELTHGIVLSFTMVYLLYRYMSKPRAVFIGLAGLCLGLILLTKLEVFPAAVLAVTAGLILIFREERPAGSRLLGLLALFAFGLMAPLACFLMYFSAQMPANQAVRSIFTGYRVVFSTDIPGEKFQQTVMGLDRPVHNLLLMLKVAGWYLLLLGPLAGADYLLRRFKAHCKYISPAVFSLGLGLSIWLFWFSNWLDLLRPLPLFMIILAGALLAALLRSSGDPAQRNRYALALVLTIFSLVLLSKMILCVRAVHYGFALAAPATLLLIVALVHWLPRLLAGSLKQGGWVFRSLILAVLIVGLAWHFNIARQVYAIKTHQVGKGSDAFMVTPQPRELALSQALESIGKIMGADETFVVFPEGVMLNYLSRRPNPTKYISFMPFELTVFGQKNILDALGHNPPDQVFVVPRNLKEYGYLSFGRDYCPKLSDWIDNNYQQQQLFGQTPGQKFPILGLRRIDKSTPAGR